MENCTEWYTADVGRVNVSCPVNKLPPYVAVRAVFAVPIFPL
jgi:hypothetical protein